MTRTIATTASARPAAFDRRLSRRSFSGLLAASALAAGAWGVTAHGATPAHADADDAPGAVYVMTNEMLGNRIAIFNRTAQGGLIAAGHVATGGHGTGGGLGSQGALTLSDDHRFLLAVNAGSHQLSAFRITRDGPVLASIVPSGGMRPTSVTVHDDLVYVLNNGSNNISAFRLGRNGDLTAISGSTRMLSAAGANGAQVQFSPDGRVLVVVERGLNRLSSFVVGRDGLASGPLTRASIGAGPFGFDFDNRGHLIISETAGGTPSGSAASSYDVARDGTLTVVTASANTYQAAACWVVVTKNGRFAYTANAGSGSVSGFAIGQGGALSLLVPSGVSATTGMGSAPIDMAVSHNSRFLYVLGNGSHMISAFRIGGQGDLTAVGSMGGLVAGAAGIAAW